MSKIENNGIVELDDIFKINPTDEVYSREEDIFSTGSKSDDEEEIKEGTLIGDDKKEDNKEVEDLEDKDDKPIVVPVNYRGILNTLSARGVIPDLKGVVFGGENGEELTIDDLDFTKEESLCDVIATIFESQKEDAVKDKIDVASVSDITKKLIRADKAGANVIDILKQYDTVSAPIEKLDLENKADQIKVIKHYVSMLDLPDDEAEEFYKGIIGRGDEYIEAKAIKYKAELDKRMDNIIQERTKAAEEKKVKDAEEFKKYKKDLKASFQAKYQLTDNVVAKAMDFSLKSVEGKPGVTRAYERIREIMMNPDEAPDLILFLMNKDEFVKQHSSKAVTEEKKKIYKLISHTSKDKRTSPINDDGTSVKGLQFDEIVLE